MLLTGGGPGQDAARAGDLPVAATLRNSSGAPPVEQSGEVSFTLENTSLRSIPLKIPGVMNPNLSPKSKSGVRLAQGQEIIYRGKTILTVGPEITEGQIIDVAALIRENR